MQALGPQPHIHKVSDIAAGYSSSSVPDMLAADDDAWDRLHRRIRALEAALTERREHKTCSGIPSESASVNHRSWQDASVTATAAASRRSGVTLAAASASSTNVWRSLEASARHLRDVSGSLKASVEAEAITKKDPSKCVGEEGSWRQALSEIRRRHLEVAAEVSRPRDSDAAQ